MTARERYLAALVGVALVFLVARQVYGAGWPSWPFPAFAVLFATAGAAAAPRSTLDRLRTLLVPFWALGLVVLPATLWHSPAPRSQDLVSWLVPVLTPPDATGTLWYVTASLWFVLMTPAMLAASRRWPVATVLAPLALVALSPVAGTVTDVGTYGSCWALGLAFHSGRLDRMPLIGAAGLATGSLALGGAAALLHHDDVARALWGLGAVLLVLRLAPRARTSARPSPLLALVEARTSTTYLWHGVAVALAGAVDDRVGLQLPWQLATPWLLVGAAVLLFGWVEDLAAGRSPALLPGPWRDAGRLLPRRGRSETGRLGT